MHLFDSLIIYFILVLIQAIIGYFIFDKFTSSNQTLNGDVMKKNIFLIFLCFTQVYCDHSKASKVLFAAGTAIGNFTQSKVLIDLSNYVPFNNSAYSYNYDTRPFNMIYQMISRTAAVYSMISSYYSASIPFINLDQAIENNTMSKDEFPFVSFGKGFINGLKRSPFYGLIKLAQQSLTGSRWAMKTFPNETFADIAGARQAKKDLQDLVEYLKNPTKFTRLGGKMNKGFLLVGGPGNGKTLLARAVAGASGCSFFHANGSDFVETFVGAGAARVRSLFNEARKNAPAIIFIDEFDSLAPKRGSHHSHAETDQTLNQLLVEMDGFNQANPDKPIIVIGSTNRIDILDPAVLRPGRFDRHITVPYPNTIEREEILTIYCNKIVVPQELDIKLLAEETSNFSGADLANLVNQAALIAAANGAYYVTYKYFQEAQKLLRSEMNITATTLNRIIPNETFDSVLGAQEAKIELNTIISFLKNPDYYSRLGAKIPRGILLEGAPGTGKTLLARAVAGEVQCSFFKVSGSEFVEKYVGVGASRIRELFNEARTHAPSIIFIDEIDAVGGARNQVESSERDQTLNQLLIEMDGFSQNTDKPVIVIAATNRADTLDKALLRPGRFDRQIIIPLPDVKTREEILDFYCKKIIIDSSVNVEIIAKATIGYSGAELANLVNQATLMATTENSDVVTAVHFARAQELIMLGAVNTSTKMNDKEKKLTAYHEAGHALVYLLSDNTAHVLQKVTIMPRSRALGLTTAQLEEEKYSYSKEELFAMIQVSLGGRIAEEVQFGVVSTGASNDFEQASNIARSMVCVYGMTDALGPISYTQDRSFGYSQKTAELIDAEVRTIINSAYQKTRTLLTTHKDKLDTLATALLEKETLDKEEIYELLGLKQK